MQYPMVRKSPPSHHLLEQPDIPSQDRRRLQRIGGNTGVLPEKWDDCARKSRSKPAGRYSRRTASETGKRRLDLRDPVENVPRTLGHLFEAKKADIKESSMKAYLHCQEHFFKQFSPTELIETITAERLLEWKTSMLVAGCATNSVAKYVQTTKMVFDWAVDQDWLTKSPGKKIPSGKMANRAKDRMISMEEYAQLLDACPNQEWRTIIALARIGGLRCPSELQGLRWSDIHWTENRFLVHSPKTERHEGHRERLVRPFDNMRMSRSNGVERKFGSKKESLWIGHSEKVMVKHYLVLEDEDFAEAACNSILS